MLLSWIEPNPGKTFLSLNLMINARTEQGAPVAGAQILANDVLIGSTGSYGTWEGITKVGLDKGSFVVRIKKGEGKKALIKEQTVFYMPADEEGIGQVKISFLTPTNHVF